MISYLFGGGAYLCYDAINIWRGTNICYYDHYEWNWINVMMLNLHVFGLLLI